MPRRTCATGSYHEHLPAVCRRRSAVPGRAERSLRRFLDTRGGRGLPAGTGEAQMGTITTNPKASIALNKNMMGKMWAVIIAGAACLAGDTGAVYQGKPIIKAPGATTVFVLSDSHTCPCGLGSPQSKASVSVQGVTISTERSASPVVSLSPGTITPLPGWPGALIYDDVDCTPPGKCDPKDKSCVPVS